MEFGKRSSSREARPAAITQETCVRCCGTGRVRERGERIVCKACAGTGRTTIKVERSA